MGDSRPGKGMIRDLRGKQGHVSAPNHGIGNLCVEGRDGDEHDGAGEGGEDVRSDHGEEVPRLHPVRGEDHDHRLSQTGGDQTTNEGVAPDVDGWVGGGPATCVVAETDLEGEINEHRQGHVLLAETLVEQLEVRDGVVGLEADLGDQMYDDDALNVLELENANHASVNFQHTVLVLCLLFTFQNDQGGRDK